MPIKVSDALQQKLTPSAKKIFEVLDALPHDNLYEANEILQFCDIGSVNTLSIAVRNHDFTRYRERDKNNAQRFLYGHPEAIRAYREG